MDPTFDIGSYNVTPITYQHLLLENRHDGKQPSMIGPVLVHDKKTTETYSTFAGTIKTFRPGLSEVLSFGTDGEKPLIDGFKNNFDRSVNLLCILHLKKNVERKLLDLGISGNVKQDILADVFGKRSGNVFESGLADAPSRENFQQQLEQLKENFRKQKQKNSLIASSVQYGRERAWVAPRTNLQQTGRRRQMVLSKTLLEGKIAERKFP